ncbi:hypothetical protein [Terriglobus tenax]|uniref:hypothetical protein n=1 Tax=Terriglobus tenax TaxID=1111115 RepID=UPI0021DF48A5|nr:hypothetical protein [Terriglobus tenax]
MIAATPERYQLKSLHEDISLMDRKLAHLQNFEVFATNDLRDAALRKMHTRRETLVKKARVLRDEGIEFLPSEIPLSLRTETEIVARQNAEEQPVPPSAAIPIDQHRRSA